MKRKLKKRELVFVASMLFGMFFGAGNLIFPVHLGQMAGRNLWLAVLGFIITGVGLPLLGVTALGKSRCGGLAPLSCRVGKPYGIFFTCALYLTIGPLFAIPRCATVPYTVSVERLLPENLLGVALPVFSLLFFAAVLLFSLRPQKILDSVGKLLNPLFLLFLFLLMGAALLFPMTGVSQVEPVPEYEQKAFFSGFLEGYNTMDALASLAFGIIVVNVIKKLGITEPDDIAANTVRAGFFACLAMALIYVMVTVAGAQSRGVYPLSENGGIALSQIADHYFGAVGTVILILTVTFACLKTAVGLVTSCSETFTALFPRSPGYRFWAVTFSISSFLVANIGLTAIINYAVPVLMFLYPLAITLILLALFSKYFGHDRAVYASVTAFTLVAALFDFVKALPAEAVSFLHMNALPELGSRVLPFFDLGMGWVCPALLGLILGLVLHARKKAA